VIRTGKPAKVARISASVLEGAARDAEHLRIIRQLAITSYMCVPLFDRGRPAGAITFVSAESAREYSDDDLRFARELAARASLAIENARTYAEAADANRLKDEFLATLSHELRTPLNAILGYARMLRSGIVAPEKTQAAIETVERNAASLNRLIEDVLDVSRIISGRIRLVIEPVDLPAVVRTAIATVQPAADAKGVTVETAVDASTPPTPADQGRLQQLIWNLLANAIKFTPSGGRVRVHVAPADGHIEIAVSDTGIGISSEFLPYVFDRFRQGDASFAREHGGLGLGLAIARHIAELHGGTIRAESAGVGRGATFTVSMPTRAGQSVPVPPPQDNVPAVDRQVDRSAARTRLGGIHVVAVDDEPDALNLMRTVLEAAGARVTAVSSANAALDEISRGGVDVLIADVGMPQVDGLQLIRNVRQLAGAARATPAAAVTAYARSDDRILTIASGFQMHLAKPVEPGELISAVAVLARRAES
jgi:signal transduction histidine kinase/ActR/RegA family two-component response regulator